MLTPSQRNRLIPVIVSIPILVQNLDSSSIATALPTMARELAINPLHLNLAITSYLLSLAVFLPLSSWFADRFGARAVFCGAILVFGAGAASCGLANGLWQLVASRIVQGMGGAMMLPIGRLLLMRTIPKQDLVKAMVWFSVSSTMGPTLGPTIGGFLVTYLSWRWIFLMSIPICIAGVALALRFVEDVHEPESPRIDKLSFLLMAVALAGLVFGFETAGRGMLAPWTVAGLLAVGTLCLVLYFRHARVSPSPAIDFTLLSIPALRAAVLGGTLIRTALGAQPFLMPLVLQMGFGMSAAKSGLITLASAFGSMTSRFFVPQVLGRVGFRNVLIWGAVGISVLFVIYGQFRPGVPVAVLVVCLLLGGMVRALLMVNLGTLGYSEVPQARMSRATALVSMMQQLSNSFGVSCGAALLNVVLLWRGNAAIGAGDFWPVFAILAVMPLTALYFFIPLPADVGAEVSGHHRRDD